MINIKSSKVLNYKIWARKLQIRAHSVHIACERKRNQEPTKVTQIKTFRWKIIIQKLIRKHRIRKHRREKLIIRKYNFHLTYDKIKQQKLMKVV